MAAITALIPALVVMAVLNFDMVLCWEVLPGHGSGNLQGVSGIKVVTLDLMQSASICSGQKEQNLT